MQLTGPQLRTIRYYLDHRDRAPTWSGFLAAFARTLMLWAVVGTVVGYYFFSIGLPAVASLFIGVMIGGALREARQHLHVCRAWPAIAAIVDWERAEAIAERGDLPDPPV